MDNSNKHSIRRVLIASGHPLFGQGLRSLLNERPGPGVMVVGVVTNLEGALVALDTLRPDLIVVDYDDEKLDREAFLARFVEGEHKLRVVLLSLQSPRDAVVYDRRKLAASRIDDWLEEWPGDDPHEQAASPLNDGLPNGAGHAAAAPAVRTAGTPGLPPAAGAALVRAGTNGRASQKADKISGMKHLVIAGIGVAVITALLIAVGGRIRLLPDVASAQAAPIDALFGQQFIVIAFLFALIVVLMLYSIIVFRRKPGDETDAPHILGNNRLEVFWTVVPLLTVLYFAYAGGKSLGDTVRAAPSPVEVNVIGSQWSWRFEYPKYGISATELVIPVDEQTLLHLSSTDVIHSFWVPEFRVKQDALPGGEEYARNLRVTPTETGEYLMMCAELCGLQHAYMNSTVRVVSRQEFDAWTAERVAASTQDPAARGKQLAEQYGCLSCHSVDGSELVGPTWKGLYGSQRPLQDGATVTAGDAYLQEAIIDPGAHVVQGYPNVMPATYADQMSAEQIADLVEYIESLK